MRRSRIIYSAAEMQWLEENRMMIISDYHRAFQKKFGRPDIAAAHLHSLRKRKGWKIGSQKGRTKGRRLVYSDTEIAWLRSNSTMPLKDCVAAFVLAFPAHAGKLTPEKLLSLRKREGLKTGRTGRFVKGAAPWSKGKKIGNNPGSARTQFKKGVAPANAKGPGHESVGDDGYVWIVTDRRNPWTGASTWRVHKHRWVWEQTNGPIPKGMVLKCKGDVLNTDPSNWELVPRGVLPRLNGKRGRGYDHAPPEVKPTIMAVAKLEQRAFEKRRRREGGSS